MPLGNPFGKYHIFLGEKPLPYPAAIIYEKLTQFSSNFLFPDNSIKPVHIVVFLGYNIRE